VARNFDLDAVINQNKTIGMSQVQVYQKNGAIDSIEESKNYL
jgi:hypothetical protein